MPSNRAAWIASERSRLRVSEAIYSPPAADELTIRSKSVAINPVDWKMQDYGHHILSYPTIFGCDVAGVVEEIGSGVTAFKEGDRVISNAVCLIKGKEYGAFQDYVKVPANVTCLLPDDMSYEEGCVIPLSLNTAAIGLFGKDNLALPMPSLDPKPSNQVVFIYGGSTSVGSNAIQLARAAGVHVVTTASKRNHDHCKGLGAESVIDYHGSTWMDQVTQAFGYREILGAYDTVCLGCTTESCAQILSQNNSKALIVTVSPPSGQVRSNTIFGENLTLNKELSQAIWADFLGPALTQRKFLPQPRPEVIGKGLEKIQDGIDMQRKGVSAQKLVVVLE